MDREKKLDNLRTGGVAIRTYNEVSLVTLNVGCNQKKTIMVTFYKLNERCGRLTLWSTSLIDVINIAATWNGWMGAQKSAFLVIHSPKKDFCCSARNHEKTFTWPWLHSFERIDGTMIIIYDYINISQLVGGMVGRIILYKPLHYNLIVGLLGRLHLSISSGTFLELMRHWFTSLWYSRIYSI